MPVACLMPPPSTVRRERRAASYRSTSRVAHGGAGGRFVTTRGGSRFTTLGCRAPDPPGSSVVVELPQRLVYAGQGIDEGLFGRFVLGAHQALEDQLALGFEFGTACGRGGVGRGKAYVD